MGCFCSYHFGRFKGEARVDCRDEVEKLDRCSVLREASEAARVPFRNAWRLLLLAIGRSACMFYVFSDQEG